MNLLRKIGTGVISLGLISSFYIPESKANPTILKLEMPSNELSGGRSYPTKIKNSLLAHGTHDKLAKQKNKSRCHKHVPARDGRGRRKVYGNIFDKCKKVKY